MSAQPGSRVPIVSGWHPDPTICRVGSRYYLAHSSFELFPGVPLWVSEDLVHWEQLGNALTRPAQFTPGSSAPNRGVYAPTLRHHDGRFWLITTNVDGPGQLAYHATDPAGPWSDPIRLYGLEGIDPDLAWDEDGTCYLTACTSAPGRYEISQARVDLHAEQLLEEPRVIWRGTGLQWPEGPHLYRIGSWWYLLIAEGGTERGHVISVARAARPDGPFTGHPQNPIFSHRSTDHPVHSVGHGDLVQTPAGDWAMVYLGSRPRGYLPGHHVLGRETFLAGIDWVDDWPVVVQDRFQLSAPDHSFTARFSEGKWPSHPRWVSPGVALADVARAEEAGLVLAPGEAENGAPSGLGFRVRDLRWTAEADVLASESAALRVRMDERHWAEVRVAEGRVEARLQVGPAEKTASEAIQGEWLTLILRAVDSLTDGPDDLVLALRDEAGERELLQVDGRYLSTETAGGFGGRLLLVHATAGPSHLMELRYQSQE
ncbi:family 43 glycosylhydrolase [Actinomyces sp. F1_1611]